MSKRTKQAERAVDTAPVDGLGTDDKSIADCKPRFPPFEDVVDSKPRVPDAGAIDAPLASGLVRYNGSLTEIDLGMKLGPAITRLDPVILRLTLQRDCAEPVALQSLDLTGNTDVARITVPLAYAPIHGQRWWLSLDTGSEGADRRKIVEIFRYIVAMRQVEEVLAELQIALQHRARQTDGQDDPLARAIRERTPLTCELLNAAERSERRTFTPVTTGE